MLWIRKERSVPAVATQFLQNPFRQHHPLSRLLPSVSTPSSSTTLMPLPSTPSRSSFLSSGQAMSGVGLPRQRTSLWPRALLPRLLSTFMPSSPFPSRPLAKSLLSWLCRPWKIKYKLVEMYDLSNYHRAELLAALPPAAGEVHTLELMDRMLALLLQAEKNNDWANRQQQPGC